jgi:hypothetical protein
LARIDLMKRILPNHSKGIQEKSGSYPIAAIRFSSQARIAPPGPGRKNPIPQPTFDKQNSSAP